MLLKYFALYCRLASLYVHCTIYVSIMFRNSSAERTLSSDEMTDRITELLQQGIRETIEKRDGMAFERAAREAYKVRTGGRGIRLFFRVPKCIKNNVTIVLHI